MNNEKIHYIFIYLHFESCLIIHTTIYIYDYNTIVYSIKIFL